MVDFLIKGFEKFVLNAWSEIRIQGWR